MTQVAHTKHYEIIDHGEDYVGRFNNRFLMQRKVEFKFSKVLDRWASGSSVQALLAPMNAAEKFHVENDRGSFGDDLFALMAGINNEMAAGRKKHVQVADGVFAMEGEA